MTDTPNAYVIALHQVQAERDAAQARAEAAEKERDDLAAKLGSGWIEREVDVRVLKDAQVSSLRDQLNAMTDARDGALARADQCEQDAHTSRQNLNTLSAMFRAAISAVVRA
jgi:chromosome segregation ATPase